MPKAYLYSRFSTPEQGEGDSGGRQARMAQEYLSRHPELELDDLLRFADEGISGFRGKNSDTGALGSFRRAVEDGNIPKGSYLLVENLDRISRQSHRKAARVLEDICEAGIAVVLLSRDKVITHALLEDDPWAFIEVLLDFKRAHDESLVKSQRIRQSWIGRIERAKAGGRKVTAAGPAWLTLDKKSGVFLPIPERVKIVKRIYQETLKGVGKHRIAIELNQEGIPVFGRGKHWHDSYIQKILASPGVVGTYVPHTDEEVNGKTVRTPLKAIKGYYPRVISDDLFARVQAFLASGASSRRGRHANGVVQNLFAGLCRCGRCDDTVTLTNKGKPPKGARYLVCTRAKSGAGCTYQAVRYDRIEKAFIESAPMLVGTMPAGDKGKGIDGLIAQTETNLEAIAESIENLISAMERGARSVSTAARLRELEVEQVDLRSSLSLLIAKREAASGARVAQRADELEVALRALPVDRTIANALMRQVFAKVVVDYVGGCIDLTWAHGGESRVTFGWPMEHTEASSSLTGAQ
jgi:DNA invertase Pin-like site-specific DNA recombinase